MLPQERFWARVQTGDGCWRWTGYTNADGYGVVGAGRDRQRAHRIAYEYIVGPIPDGMYLLHRCDHPWCVRPSHMFVGTQADNIRDMDAKGRRGDTRRKVDDVAVQAIRRMRNAGASHQTIADTFGISRPSVSMILAGKRWGHV